jgi:hypothetical protein
MVMQEANHVIPRRGIWGRAFHEVVLESCHPALRDSGSCYFTMLVYHHGIPRCGIWDRDFHDVRLSSYHPALRDSGSWFS